MIYLTETSEKLIIPRVSNDMPVSIVFKNHLDKKTVEIFSIELSGKYYYEVDVENELDKFETGQYNYEVLSEDGSVLYSGIAQFGEYKDNTDQYKKEITEIKQYEL